MAGPFTVDLPAVPPRSVLVDLSALQEGSVEGKAEGSEPEPPSRGIFICVLME